MRREIVISYAGNEADSSALPHGMTLDDFIGPYEARDIPFRQLPFDHPLFIMYSSGTTGIPKCIVHGAGGTLIQHQKEHLLHCDIKPDNFLLNDDADLKLIDFTISKRIAKGISAVFRKRGTIRGTRRRHVAQARVRYGAVQWSA